MVCSREAIYSRNTALDSVAAKLTDTESKKVSIREAEKDHNSR